MLDIDGSQKSGSGTILRLSIALSAITQEPLHISNIRHNRKNPGLRPQHLQSVKTAAKLCNAETKGVTLDSRELWFKPQKIMNDKIRVEIGTAGSISMLLMTVLPICAFSTKEVQVHVINGGTDVRHAPTINYIKCILLPILGLMGLESSLEIKKYGYYPKGMGEVILHVKPSQKLTPFKMEDVGEIKEIQGISVSTFLEQQKVAKRQAEAASKILRIRGFNPKIQVVNDKSNPLQKGSSILLFAKTSKGAILGGDAIGEWGKPSETVGKEAAKNLLQEIETKATVDVHLADILIPYIALANDPSTYLVRKMTGHINTNIWLTEKILGTKINVTKIDNLYRINT